jgi:hypothetical protein
MPGFEPNWTSDRKALCAKQLVKLYATHALQGLPSSLVVGLVTRFKWPLRSSCHVLHTCYAGSATWDIILLASLLVERAHALE